jgi:hypothetical protein
MNTGLMDNWVSATVSAPVMAVVAIDLDRWESATVSMPMVLPAAGGSVVPQIMASLRHRWG